MRSLSALLAALWLLAGQAEAADTAREQAPQAGPAEPAAPVGDPVEAATRTINNEWAEIFYRLPAEQQTGKFKALLTRIRSLKAQHPNRAEPLVIEAITLCTLAASDWGFDSLSRIDEARQLLEKSIGMDPRAMEGTALITLGNLFYRLPGWPISFGDDELARQYLERAVKMYPDGLDSNYFLGDFWLREEEFDKATVYLEKANQVPVRPYHQLSDLKVRHEAGRALKAARNRDSGYGDFFSEISPELGE